MKYKPILIVLAALFILVSCGDKEVSSKWKTNTITIDGNLDEWQGELIFNSDENAAIGIKNDNDFIYLCVTTKVKTKVMPIIRNGFTVWFEPEDGKALGIKYPLKKEFDFMPMGEMHPMSRGKEKGRREEENDFAKMSIDFMDQPEFQVVNDEEYPLYQFAVDDTSGYQVKMSYNNQQLVYELKIPIEGNHHKYESLNVKAGGKLSIGFETGEMERPSGGSGKGHEGMSMGGGPGGGGRPGGGMNGGVPGGQWGGPGGMLGDQITSSDAVNFAVDVTLAVSK